MSEGRIVTRWWEKAEAKERQLLAQGGVVDRVLSEVEDVLERVRTESKKLRQIALELGQIKRGVTHEQRAVAEHVKKFLRERTGVNVDIETNARATVWMRQVAMFLIYEIDQTASYPSVARCFPGRSCGIRHHTTVFHAVKMVNRKIRIDFRARKQVAGFLNELRNGNVPPVLAGQVQSTISEQKGLF